MSKILMSHGFSLPVECVFDEDGVPFQIDDSFGDLLIDGESTCDETNYELVAHAINTHDDHVKRIADLERQLKAEREINDRLRVVETERAVRNDELCEALGEVVNALYSSYDATEWPADGTSYQEVTALKGEATLEKHKDQHGERPLKYIAIQYSRGVYGSLFDSEQEAREEHPYADEIIPIRVSGDYDE